MIRAMPMRPIWTRHKAQYRLQCQNQAACSALVQSSHLLSHHRPVEISLRGRTPLQNTAFLTSTTKCFGGSSRYHMHTLSGVSLRDMADLEDRLWAQVGAKVQDPILEENLVTLNWMHRRLAVSEDGTVQILLRLPTLLHPSLSVLKDLVKSAAEKEIEQWSAGRGLKIQAKVNVEAISTKALPWMVTDDEGQQDVVSRLGPGLANVRHFLAVYSCKGGVGKSTIAVNLAYELARMGGRIGLLDVDVYGPSLPILVKPDDPTVRRSPLGAGMVYPINHGGVKLLSLGFVSPKSGVPGRGEGGDATIIRGPMAGKVVAQLLKGTDWGDLDVLVLDLPPGTGDVQLAVCQDLQLSGAVAVTTPSKLATADVRKGIEMFSTLDVKTIALVENMAFFECEGGGRHFPFGKGLQHFLKENDTHLDINMNNICQLPISTVANDANDSGSPLCLTRPAEGAKELAAFEQLAQMVSRELFLLPHRSSVQNPNQIVYFEGKADERFDLVTVHLSLDSDNERPLLIRIFSESGALQIRVAPAELRNRDPKTGEKIETPTGQQETKPQLDDGMVTIHRSSSRDSVKRLIPVSVEKKGKYGYAVAWDDGAKIIYSMLAVAKSAGARLQENQS